MIVLIIITIIIIIVLIIIIIVLIIIIIVLIIIIQLYKMEFQEIVNLLDITSDDKDLSRFVTKKWIEVYDQSEKKLQC